MKTLTCAYHGIWIVVLAVLFGAGCATAPREVKFLPITDAHHRFEVWGVSMLPPGTNWQVARIEVPQVRKVIFGKPVQPQTEIPPTVVLSSQVERLDLSKYKGGQQEYLDAVKRAKDAPPAQGRFRLITRESSTEPFLETKCLRYHIVIEELNNPRFPSGTTLVLEKEMLYCFHPDDPSLFIILEGSERHTNGGARDQEWKIVWEEFLNSHRFTKPNILAR
jgi:hypothetical protein